MKCEYPECDAKAEFKLGLADPDSEKSHYCGGHVDIRRREIMMELFMDDKRCNVVVKSGIRCYNSKRFGDYCGIHAKQRIRNKTLCKCGHDLDFHGESCSHCRCEEFNEVKNNGCI